MKKMPKDKTLTQPEEKMTEKFVSRRKLWFGGYFGNACLKYLANEGKKFFKMFCFLLS